MGGAVMVLITETYRALNARQHKVQHKYGCSGSKYAEHAMEVAGKLGAASVLDYGCGKCTLGTMIAHLIAYKGYDPAIPHLASDPEPADLVACTDVMEHVEPECVGDVLAHIRSLSIKGAVFVICTERGGRKLADGSLAHCSVHDAAWWRDRLARHWRTVERRRVSADLYAYVCE
jgi:2-polyprenyl-3-methyl-5-hydroxy-6-metoxy-1,4-benzoquinol methylase